MSKNLSHNPESHTSTKVTKKAFTGPNGEEGEEIIEETTTERITESS